MKSPILLPFLILLNVIAVSAVRSQTFGPDVLVDTSVVGLVGQYIADISVDSEGDVGVVWIDQTVDNDIVNFAISTDGGQTFQKTIVEDSPLQHFGDARYDAVLAFDMNNNPWVAWQYDIWEYIGGGIQQLSRSLDGGESFSNPFFNYLTEPLWGQSLTIDQSNNVYLGWLDNWALSCTRFLEGDTSTPSNTVINTDSLDLFFPPWISVDKTCEVYLVFQGGLIRGMDPTRWRIYFVKSTDAGETFSLPRIIEPPEADSLVSQTQPCLAMDSMGVVFVAWADNRSGDWDIYLAKSLDSGDSFIKSKRVNTQVGGDQFQAELSYNSSTGLCAAWIEGDNLLDNDIYFTQSTDGGETFSDGILIGGEEHQEFYQGLGGIATDDSGNVYIAYTDNRFGKQLLFVTKAALESTNVLEEPSLLALPEQATLQQNYPNPFNAETVIRYQIPDNSYRVTLQIFDLLGRAVRTLVDKKQDGENYQVVWDGKDKDGKDVGSGVYFCSLKVGSVVRTKKIVLIR